jgi:hypothetical protein
VEGNKLQLQMGEVKTTNTDPIADVVHVCGEKNAHARAAKRPEKPLECQPDVAKVIEK